MKKEKLTVTCVPTSFQARQLILEASLPLADLNTCPEVDPLVNLTLRLSLSLPLLTTSLCVSISPKPKLDVAFDGADEVSSSLDMIKGGGGAQLQEKIVASCAKQLVIVADDSKKASDLLTVWRKGVPVEVVPLAYVAVTKRLSALGGRADLRMAKAKAGPVVTGWTRGHG